MEAFKCSQYEVESLKIPNLFENQGMMLKIGHFDDTQRI